MKPVNASGMLYSARGISFGGIPFEYFLQQTEDIEKIKPFVREEIICEAHYLILWQYSFPEILFLLSLITTNSIFVGFISIFIAYILEIYRFYNYGPSYSISKICMEWDNWAKYLSFSLGLLYFYENYNIVIIIILIAFLILQVWLGFLIPILGVTRNFIITLILKKILPIYQDMYGIVKELGPKVYNIESLAILLIINRWKKDLISYLKTNLCPVCGTKEVHLAYIEDGGIGNWCPNCKKSLKKMAEEGLIR
jgi:hypothetical protein